jgi:hypothetical protein
MEWADWQDGGNYLVAEPGVARVDVPVLWDMLKGNRNVCSLADRWDSVSKEERL